MLSDTSWYLIGFEVFSVIRNLFMLSAVWLLYSVTKISALSDWSRKKSAKLSNTAGIAIII
jgi:hypothetical protein